MILFRRPKQNDSCVQVKGRAQVDKGKIWSPLADFWPNKMMDPASIQKVGLRVGAFPLGVCSRSTLNKRNSRAIWLLAEATQREGTLTAALYTCRAQAHNSAVASQPPRSLVAPARKAAPPAAVTLPPPAATAAAATPLPAVLPSVSPLHEVSDILQRSGSVASRPAPAISPAPQVAAVAAPAPAPFAPPKSLAPVHTGEEGHLDHSIKARDHCLSTASDMLSGRLPGNHCMAGQEVNVLFVAPHLSCTFPARSLRSRRPLCAGAAHQPLQQQQSPVWLAGADFSNAASVGGAEPSNGAA